MWLWFQSTLSTFHFKLSPLTRKKFWKIVFWNYLWNTFERALGTGIQLQAKHAKSHMNKDLKYFCLVLIDNDLSLYCFNKHFIWQSIMSFALSNSFNLTVLFFIRFFFIQIHSIYIEARSTVERRACSVKQVPVQVLLLF
jgi:hypothetical protein